MLVRATGLQTTSAPWAVEWLRSMLRQARMIRGQIRGLAEQQRERNERIAGLLREQRPLAAEIARLGDMTPTKVRDDHDRVSALLKREQAAAAQIQAQIDALQNLNGAATHQATAMLSVVPDAQAIENEEDGIR